MSLKIILERIELVGKNYFTTKKGADKLLSKSAAAGTRLAPSRGENKDPEDGLRFDFGEITDRNGRQVRQVKVQPNKGAKDPSLKALAQKNSHQVLAEAYVDVNHPDSREAAKQVISDLKDDAVRKDDEEEAKKQPKKGGKQGGKK